MKIATIKIPKHARCLVVEDAEVRIEWFQKKLPYCVIAQNPTEALSILSDKLDVGFATLTHEFDIVFLDHDCAESQFVDPSDPEFLNKSFWSVAQRLHRMEFEGLVVIHSGNPVGARRMEALLASVCKVSVMPFGSFDIEVIR